MRRLVLAFGALVSTMGMAVAADGAYRAAAENWLSLVDHGHYADSCAQASAYFRSAITEAAWVQAVKAGGEGRGGAARHVDGARPASRHRRDDLAGRPGRRVRGAANSAPASQTRPQRS